MKDERYYSNEFQKIIEGTSPQDAWKLLEYIEDNKLVSERFLWSHKGIFAMLLEEYINAIIFFEKAIELDVNCEDVDLQYNYLYALRYIGNIEAFEARYAKIGMLKPTLISNLNEHFSISRLSEFKHITIGTMAIGNQSALLKKELSTLGIEATIVDFYPNYLKCDSDIVVDLSKFNSFGTANEECRKVATNMISKSDLFHFNFATSLTLDYSDLEVIKQLNKPIIMQFWGSDIRLKSVAEKFNPYIKVKEHDESKIINRMKFLSKYTDVCIVDYELREYAKDYFENIFISRAMIDLDSISVVQKTKKQKTFRIVHAPTSREFKGTEYIVKAVEKLKKTEDIELILVEGKSHADAMLIYQTADVVIDQLHAGLYGMLAIECMAYGIPVVTWITEKNRELLGVDLPIISANPDNIYSILKDLIHNKELLDYSASMGRKYVEKYHDSKILTERLLNLYYKMWNKKSEVKR